MLQNQQQMPDVRPAHLDKDELRQELRDPGHHRDAADDRQVVRQQPHLRHRECQAVHLMIMPSCHGQMATIMEICAIRGRLRINVDQADRGADGKSPMGCLSAPIKLIDISP